MNEQYKLDKSVKAPPCIAVSEGCPQLMCDKVNQKNYKEYHEYLENRKNNEHTQVAESCIFCESHEHCADAHPFNTLNELIEVIPIGEHIPCGISDSNATRIREGIKQAFRTYT